MKFTFLYGSMLVLLFWGCTKKYNVASTLVPDKIALPTSIESLVKLDSTYVGTSTVISGLDVPWELIWGPDNWIWFTEQGGTVSKVNPATGERKVLLRIPAVYRKRSMGLLGMALHPDFKKSPHVYLDYTYLKEDKVLSKLVRYTYAADSLINPIILLNDIPGANGHNGARILISPDKKIMLTTGDATNGKNSQNTNSRNGKVLRLNLDGSIPKDNPLPGNPVWSWGHRNQQGLVYTANGILFSSEHGDASDDEVNIIRKGANFGWPNVQGFCDSPEEKNFCAHTLVTEPLKAWTPTIAPAGIEYYNAPAIPEWQNAIILTTLKENDLRVLRLNPDGNAVVSEKIYFKKAFGRLRDVCVAPNGDIYVATSNRDWNPAEGFPLPQDDRIIRIFRVKDNTRMAGGLVKSTPAATEPEAPQSGGVISKGKALYTQYCGACHKSNGQGVAETFPPLQGSEWVVGEPENLIKVVLQGLSGEIKVKGETYSQQMPAFNFLPDQKIAEVLSYVRSEFGNSAANISAEAVNKVRLNK